MLIIASSIGSASSSRPASGADSTGLPAIVMSARTCPSPGVAISSARHDSGAWPSTSGAPRTRVCHRPVLSGPRRRAVDEIVAIAGRGNSAPPSMPKCPVRMLTTSTNHDASVPNSWLHRPMRPYTTARRCAGQLAGQRADPLGVDAAPVGDGLGREVARRDEHLVDALHATLERDRG